MEQIVQNETNIYDVIIFIIIMVSMVYLALVYLRFAKSEAGRKIIEVRQKHKTEREKARYDYRLKMKTLKNERRFIKKKKTDNYKADDLQLQKGE